MTLDSYTCRNRPSLVDLGGSWRVERDKVSYPEVGDAEY